MKVALLFDNFGPYHWARAAAAAGCCDLLAVQFGSTSDTYAWAQEAGGKAALRTLNPDGPSTALPGVDMRKRLEPVLADFGPDAVMVPGWSSREALMALRWCGATGTPAVAMSESTPWDAPRTRCREAIKRRLLRLFSAALVGGSPHADYVLQLGIPLDRVFLGYDAVDSSYFAAEAARHRAGVPPLCRPYFLSSNRFVKRKNLLRLIEAYAAYLKLGRGHTTALQPPVCDCWNLCLLGGGEQEPALLARCQALGLKVIETAPWDSALTPDSCPLSPGIVFFPGFRQINELPRFYAHAGCFIHPALTEPWGLVVNEAMASGLPVVVSNRCGCAPDLVQDGVNGSTFDPYKVEELAQLMLRVAAFNFPLSAFGDASKRIVSDWGPERFAAGFKAAADKAVEVGPVRPVLGDRLLLELLCRLH